MDATCRLTCAEFWVSMLLMYNRVNAWLPFKAVPPNRQEIQDIFNYYDRDDSNNLSYDEFRCAHDCNQAASIKRRCMDTL
jgi:Ca2+-binding EF-hand superfamily protein